MVIHPYYQGPFYARIDKRMLAAYVTSGVLITLADYAAFTLCFSLLGSGLLAATATAYACGLIVSYLLNRYWVFQKGANRQSMATSLGRYLAFLLVNLSITYGMLWILEQQLSISPYLGKLVVGAFMFFWIYAGNTFWVFKGEKVGPIKL